MKTESKEVKFKKEVVGTANFTVYENFEEVTSALSQDEILKIVNRQSKAQAISNVRAVAANDTPSRKIARIMKQLRSGELTAESARSQAEAVLATLA